MPLEVTDEEIVRQTLIDKDVFAKLIMRYETKLARYLERLGVRAREDKEDILQNAFINAYRKLNDFDLTLAFSSWMYRITHNEAMNFFRARRIRPQVFLDETSESLITELKDDEADTSSMAEQRLSREKLAQAIATLEPKYRDILALRFFENRSYAEMSDILEVPVGTVSTLVHRAKKTLRARLPNSFPI